MIRELISKHKKLIRQLVLFGLIGGTSLALDVVVSTILYDKASLPAYLASSFGFISAFFFNFPLNRKHVFQHTDRDRFSLKTQLLLYASLSIFNLFMTGAITQIMVSEMKIQISISRIAVVALIAIWNFITYRKFIFSKRPIEDIERIIVQ